MLPFGAALLLGLCQAFGYPLSWRKLQLGPEVVGLQLCFRSLAFRLPSSKIVRLLQALRDVLEPASTTVKSLEKLIGILHWVMQMCPQLRPWLCFLYFDKDRPPATNFSASLPVWQKMSCYLDDNMVFHTRPPGTSISVGAVLLAARHRALKSKKDLAMVKCTGKRMWMRVADPGTSVGSVLRRDNLLNFGPFA